MTDNNQEQQNIPEIYQGKKPEVAKEMDKILSGDYKKWVDSAEKKAEKNLKIAALNSKLNHLNKDPANNIVEIKKTIAEVQKLIRGA